MERGGQEWLNARRRPALLEPRAEALGHLDRFVVEEQVADLKAGVIPGVEGRLEWLCTSPPRASHAWDVEKIGNRCRRHVRS